MTASRRLRWQPASSSEASGKPGAVHASRLKGSEPALTLHGDLYAHNILWDGSVGDAVLSDFGAACLLRPARDDSLKRVEVRAFGLLIGELLELAQDETEALMILREIQTNCVQRLPAQRPSMAEIVRTIT